MTYADAIAYLQSLGQFGMVLGLDRIKQLSELAGNPHQDLRFVHVAGTNGKGSTCAFLESIFRRAGYRTGLYTSPHLVSFTERIQLNRQSISEEQVVDLVIRLKPLAENLGATNQPTFFEFVTLMALCHFSQEQPDIVIWETGLGGRLDATNIVTPLLSVITNVQADHEQWLGQTLPEIAREKAGIIKPKVPVVIGTVPDDIHQVLKEVAESNEAPFSICNVDWVQSLGWFKDVHLPLKGSHQRFNAALAVKAVLALEQNFPINSVDLQLGLEATQWSGRFQMVSTGKGRQLLLDGAHNPAGVQALCRTVGEEFVDQEITLVMGMLQDKDWRPMALELAAIAHRIITVDVPNPRTVPAFQLAEYLRPHFPDCSVEPMESIDQVLAATEKDPVTLVSGSLYLIGATIAFLQQSPAHHELNHWKVPI